MTACTTMGCPNPGTIRGRYNDGELSAHVTYCPDCAADLHELFVEGGQQLPRTPVGTTWDVVSVTKITDGDTLRVIRSRIEHMGDHDFRVTDVDSMPIRLVWVDTPERGDHPGWEDARGDLTYWVGMHRGSGQPTSLRVVVYESAGWDRMLGDLIDADANSASQWLMVEKGWPPYVR